MEFWVFLLFLILIVGLLFVFFQRFTKEQTELRLTLAESLKSLQTQQLQDSRNLTTNLSSSYRHLFDRLDHASTVISDLKKEAGALSEVSKSIHSLELFLKHPKSRGQIGETILKDLVSQILPKSSYHTQHTLKSGSIVDMAIVTKNGLLSIDSKFPLENYQKIVGSTTDDQKLLYQKLFIKDLHDHVKAIAQKYIQPDSGTLDFALMYIPSESVYYDAINHEDVIKYSQQSRVFLVSPSTIYLHLQLILLSLESHKIADRSQKLLSLLRRLEGDQHKLANAFQTLNRHLHNAHQQSQTVFDHINALGMNLERTRLLDSSTDIDPKDELPQ